MVISGFPLSISGIEVWCRGIGGGIVLTWTCERFSFCPHLGLKWGPLDLLSCTLPLGDSNFLFSPLTFSGIEVWCRGIGDGIVLIRPVKDFLFAHTRV